MYSYHLGVFLFAVLSNTISVFLPNVVKPDLDGKWQYLSIGMNFLIVRALIKFGLTW